MSDGVFKHAAAVSFATLISLAPITIISATVAGFFFGRDTVDQQLSTQISDLLGSQSAEVVRTAVAGSRQHSHGWVSGIVGVVILIVAATSVFRQLQESLNDIWGVTARRNQSGVIVMLIRRTMSFAMVLTLGFLLLVSLAVNTLVSSLAHAEHSHLPPAEAHFVDTGGSLVVITLLFAVLFKVLPDVRLQWREVWVGALLTSVLFSLGRLGIAYYLVHSSVATSYGAAGSLVALLFWIYYTCVLLFFGAEYVREFCLEYNLPVEPKGTAVWVRHEALPEGEAPPPKN